MKIAGLQKTTLIDYPDHIATIIFTQGCNFQCGYCHNPTLITNSIEEDPYLPEEEFWNFLNQRKNLIDAVVITGGEPTLQQDLTEFIQKIKSYDLKVKLDTNGTQAELLKNLIQENLIDYIAMDIKAPLGEYPKIVGECNTEEIKKSIKLIKESNLDYEFRTTVVPTLHSLEDMKEIAKLITGAKEYFIQNFRPVNTFNSKLLDLSPFPPQKLEEFKDIVKPYVKKVKIRN